MQELQQANCIRIVGYSARGAVSPDMSRAPRSRAGGPPLLRRDRAEATTERPMLGPNKKPC
jgi:hypothetical protein